jgi:hypothetical protein
MRYCHALAARLICTLSPLIKRLMTNPNIEVTSKIKTNHPVGRFSLKILFIKPTTNKSIMMLARTLIT